MSNRILPLYALLFLLCIGCKSKNVAISTTTPAVSSSRIAFYNVENLFDTKDDPKKKDEEFTPSSKKEWTKERYQKKLFNIAKVIAGMELPGLVGLCEVENSKVLKDLCKQTSLKSVKYGFVHEESPDVRGIDVALLYDKSVFKVEEHKAIPINFPEAIVKDYVTRDILHVKGNYQGKTLHVFVNHWPSRYGGAKESEPKRIFVAEQLRKAVENIFEVDAEANVVIVGDFNDETNNKSIVQALGTQRDISRIKPKSLYNCFAPLDELQQGSYNYRGNLNLLDQIIVSTPLADTNTLPYVHEATIYRPEWVSFRHPKNGTTPNRTYGGPNYYGGFSDHYAVYVDLRLK